MSLLNAPAPDFLLEDQNGKTHSLKEYAGKYVLLYFYPKDMTPGCTIEAKKFRDLLNKHRDLQLVILGVSADDLKSHQKFATTCELNFPLLADGDHALANAYGVWQEKSMFGRKYMGIQRDSFLIDPKGVIVKHYEKVKPLEHAQEVYEDVMKLKG